MCFGVPGFLKCNPFKRHLLLLKSVIVFICKLYTVLKSALGMSSTYTIVRTEAHQVAREAKSCSHCPAVSLGHYMAWWELILSLVCQGRRGTPQDARQEPLACTLGFLSPPKSGWPLSLLRRAPVLKCSQQPAVIVAVISIP